MAEAAGSDADLTPDVSVCLLTYNHAAFVRQTVDSILSQQVTFSWEFIIADDCSTDGTTEILREYAQQHPTLIKLIVQPVNVGAAENSQILLNAPRGRYVAVCEGDDYWSDDLKLKKQVEFLAANPEYVLCFTRGVIDNTVTNVTRVAPSSSEPWDVTIQDFIASNSQLSASCVYRTSPETRIRPDWFLQSPFGDLALYLWLLQSSGLKARCLSDVTCVYRVHAGGAFGSLTKTRRSSIKAHEQYITFLVLLQRHLFSGQAHQADLMKALIERFQILNQLYAETYQPIPAIRNIVRSAYCTGRVEPAYRNIQTLIKKMLSLAAKRVWNMARWQGAK